VKCARRYGQPRAAPGTHAARAEGELDLAGENEERKDRAGVRVGRHVEAGGEVELADREPRIAAEDRQAEAVAVDELARARRGNDRVGDGAAASASDGLERVGE
jgi:hypothetical protein